MYSSLKQVSNVGEMHNYLEEFVSLHYTQR